MLIYYAFYLYVASSAVALLLKLFMTAVNRIERIKSADCLYVIHAKTENEFIQEFRLSRRTVFQLVTEFQESAIYTELRTSGRGAYSMYLCHCSDTCLLSRNKLLN